MYFLFSTVLLVRMSEEKEVYECVNLNGSLLEIKDIVCVN